MKNSKTHNGYYANRYGLIRVCSLPYETIKRLLVEKKELVAVIDKLLEDPFLLDALYLSNPHLMSRFLQQKARDRNSDIYVTLAKYILRMSFRSTPFGGFAAVSSIKIGQQKSATIDINQRKNFYYSLQLDSKLKAQITESVIKEKLLRHSIPLSVNDTIYSKNSTIRFYKYTTNKNGKRVYYLSEVEIDKELTIIIKIASNPITFRELLNRLQYLPYTQVELELYLDELINEQILVFDHLNDLTSDNWIQNIRNYLPPENQYYKTLLEIESVLRKMRISPRCEIIAA